MDNPLALPSIEASSSNSDNPLALPAVDNSSANQNNPLALPPINKDKHVVTQEFGNINPNVEVMSNGFNSGADFDYKVGTPVTAPQGDWNVEEAYADDTQPGYIGDSTNSGYGNSALLRNKLTGETIRLSHLSKNYLKPGMTVSSGAILGLSGDTGNVTGPHLDVEYRDAKGNLADVTKTPYSY